MQQTSPSIFRLLCYLIISYSVTFLAVLIGISSQVGYWLLFDSFGRHEKRSRRKLQHVNDHKNSDDEYYALIIGSGFSGIGMSIKLNQLGVDNYVVLERHGHAGGTWYANKYPGCACDVPSNLYSFSFEPNPNWSYYFSRQPEIAEYLEKCIDKYDVRRHIRFNTTVTCLRWIDERQIWEVTVDSTEGEKRYYSRIVIAGSGPLSNPSYPEDISGMDTFEGDIFHTGKWKNTVNFENKRVAVVGTGASAIQVVPAVQQMGVRQLFVFQRTPPWVIPRLDRCVSNFEKRLFTLFPSLQKFIRRVIYWSREAYVLSFVYRWPIRFINETLVNQNLRMQVKDEELRKKVTPSWELGCKRVLVTSDWYPALQKPNVKLVTNRIKEIKPHSIVTYDGDEYPVDIIILSTGFQTQKFSIPTFGINGCSLAERWSESMQAYRGITVPDYPNLFILLGPNSRLGHSSVIIMLEAQLKYITDALYFMDQNQIRSVAVKENAHDQYNQSIQTKLKKTVWHSGGCHSWYQDAKGNVTTLWPDFTWKFHRLMRVFDFENYILQK